jgi:hypothetical protein
MVVGAVLRFAITLPNPVVDFGVVGVILMGGGFVALGMGILFALLPKSSVSTVIGDRAEALPPTRPYDRPTR